MKNTDETTMNLVLQGLPGCMPSLERIAALTAPERTVRVLPGADGAGVGTFGDARLSGSVLVFGMLAGVGF